MRLPRTTGALSGLLIILLGIWGGLIPFIGPYFHYAFGGTQAWHYTTQRLWLDIVPAAVAVIGGFMLLTAATRTGGLTAGWVALAAGAWFVVGPSVSLLWHHASYPIGHPYGGTTRQMLEWIGYFYGLGALIVGFAAFAMGRYFSRPRVVEEPVAAAAAPAGAAAPVRHPATTAGAATAGAATTRAADAPATRPTTTDAPATRATTTDAPATGATTTEARAADARAAEPVTTTDAPATTGGVATRPRRRGGLLGLFRRR